MKREMRSILGILSLGKAAQADWMDITLGALCDKQILDGRTKKHIYTREGSPYAVIIWQNSTKDWLIIDKDNLDLCFSGKYQVKYSRGEGGDGRRVSPVIDVDGKRNVKLHRVICGVLQDDREVDHITHNLSICTRESLRACTQEQNNQNKRNRKKLSHSEYDYDFHKDFSETSFLYAIWKMGVANLTDSDVSDIQTAYYKKYYPELVA